ncbi:uncharacterized protein LOC122396634 [Colletes gigas]|uniref:uncharacterized protein LOC122396634 n=1 Tax=Colletes gigas TaxID=935657 RepID=UPI001C9BA969|nr:uncharacterized protein LOC122396634 [Colletes gigas]XP_043251143.1 uncharacterized protein LOC122396634 [Colletes gigas]
MDDRELILNVKEYEELYDTSTTDYYNQLVRDKIWEEIAAKMGVTGKRCKTRWSYLRDLYMKSRKTRKMRRVDGSTTTKPWTYEYEMEFLNPFLGQLKSSQFIRNRRQGLQHKSELRLPEEITLNAVANNVPPSSLTPNRVSPPPPPSSPSLDQSLKCTFRKPESVSSAAFVQDASNGRPAPPGDALLKYFEAVTETVRGFPPTLQVKVKSEISKIVHQAELEHIQQTQFEPFLQPGQDLTHIQFSPDNTVNSQYEFECCVTKQEQPG